MDFVALALLRAVVQKPQFRIFYPQHCRTKRAAHNGKLFEMHRSAFGVCAAVAKNDALSVEMRQNGCERRLLNTSDPSHDKIRAGQQSARASRGNKSLYVRIVLKLVASLDHAAVFLCSDSNGRHVVVGYDFFRRENGNPIRPSLQNRTQFILFAGKNDFEILILFESEKRAFHDFVRSVVAAVSVYDYFHFFS